MELMLLIGAACAFVLALVVLFSIARIWCYTRMSSVKIDRIHRLLQHQFPDSAKTETEERWPSRRCDLT